LQALTEFASVRMINPIPIPFWSARRTAVERSNDQPPTWFVPMPYVPLVGKPFNVACYVRSVLPLLSPWTESGLVDVIDAHFCWPDGVATAKLARKLNVPYVVTLRGLLRRYTSDPTKRATIARSLRQAAAVIAVSDDLKQQAVRLGVSADHVMVIPNGVDTDRFRPGDRAAVRRELRRDAQEVILITVGHLCRRKGFHRILEIMPDLLKRHTNIRYVMIGDDGGEGRFARRLRRTTRRLALDEYVTFTGGLEPPEVARWLQAADLFVLPTTNEGCCNALLEALATGLPVVCTDVGGNREWVSAAVGRLVRPNDRHELLDAILHTLSEVRMAPPRAAGSTPLPSRSRLGRVQGRGSVCGAPNAALRSWSQVGQETAQVMQQVLGRLCDRSNACEWARHWDPSGPVNSAVKWARKTDPPCEQRTVDGEKSERRKAK